MGGHPGNDYETHKKINVILSRMKQGSSTHYYNLKSEVVIRKCLLNHTKIEQTEMWAEHVTMY